MAKIKSVPLLPATAIQTSFELSEQRSKRLTYNLLNTYNPTFEDYRTDLQGYFTKYFSENLDPKTRTPVWSLTTARRYKSLDKLKESFNEAVDSTESDAQDLMDQELVDQLEESYLHGLWGIYESGVDLGDDPPSMGSRDLMKNFLLGMGIAGISYSERLHLAGTMAKQRFVTWLRTMISGERSLPDTLQGFDRISNSLKSRVSMLSENENHRSFIFGTEVASSAYKPQLQGSVWLSKPDSCKLCLPYNMMITTALPVSSTHPGCRCTKVPIALDYQGRPVDYVSFLQSIGKR